jgi:hypothetical protein
VALGPPQQFALACLPPLQALRQALDRTEVTLTEPYQPCNGTEGEWFFEEWCEHCARDRVLNGEARTLKEQEDPDNWCPIIARTMAFNVGDAEYPVEWIRDVGEWPGNPRCTAFVPVGQPIQPPRDEQTLPLFKEDN